MIEEEKVECKLRVEHMEILDSHGAPSRDEAFAAIVREVEGPEWERARKDLGEAHQTRVHKPLDANKPPERRTVTLDLNHNTRKLMHEWNLRRGLLSRQAAVIVSDVLESVRRWREITSLEAELGVLEKRTKEVKEQLLRHKPW